MFLIDRAERVGAGLSIGHRVTQHLFRQHDFEGGQRGCADAGQSKSRAQTDQKTDHAIILIRPQGLLPQRQGGLVRGMMRIVVGQHGSDSFVTDDRIFGRVYGQSIRMTG